MLLVAASCEAEQLKRIQDSESHLQRAKAKAEQLVELERQLNSEIGPLQTATTEQQRRIEMVEASLSAQKQELAKAEAEAQRLTEKENRLRTEAEARGKRRRRLALSKRKTSECKRKLR